MLTFLFLLLAAISFLELNFLIIVLVFLGAMEIIEMLRMSLEILFSKVPLLMYDRFDYFLQYLDCVLGIVSVVLSSLYLNGVSLLLTVCICPKMAGSLLKTLKFIIETSIEQGENLFKTIRVGFLVGTIVLSFCIAFKIDEFVEADWLKMLWPLWIMLSFVGLLLLGFIIAIVVHLYKNFFLKKPFEKIEFYCMTYCSLCLITIIIVALPFAFGLALFEDNFFMKLPMGFFCILDSLLLLINFLFLLTTRKSLVIFLVAVEKSILEQRRKRRIQNTSRQGENQIPNDRTVDNILEETTRQDGELQGESKGSKQSVELPKYLKKVNESYYQRASAQEIFYVKMEAKKKVIDKKVGSFRQIGMPSKTKIRSQRIIEKDKKSNSNQLQVQPQNKFSSINQHYLNLNVNENSRKKSSSSQQIDNMFEEQRIEDEEKSKYSSIQLPDLSQLDDQKANFGIVPVPVFKQKKRQRHRKRSDRKMTVKMFNEAFSSPSKVKRNLRTPKGILKKKQIALGSHTLSKPKTEVNDFRMNLLQFVDEEEPIKKVKSKSLKNKIKKFKKQFKKKNKLEDVIEKRKWQFTSRNEVDLIKRPLSGGRGIPNINLAEEEERSYISEYIFSLTRIDIDDRDGAYLQQLYKEVPKDKILAASCLICFDNQQDCVIMNCGHAGFCKSCAVEIFERADPCPICRQVYLSLTPRKQSRSAQ